MKQIIRDCAYRAACLVLVALVLAGGAAWLGGGAISTVEAAGSASITSDKPDYHPGETVTLTGAGWQPGENVMIVISVDPLTHGPDTLLAVADDAGNFTNSSYVVQQSDLGVTFTATATGDQGSMAQTTFTDSDTTTVTITGNGNVKDNGHANTINCTETNGTASGTCSNTYSSGTGTVTLTATPASGYTFSSWTNTGSVTCAPSGSTCSFTTATSSHTVTVKATFVALTATTTALVSSTNPSTFGQSVTFTATVSPIPTTGDTVTFKDGATTLGTGTTDVSGVATFTTSALSVAAHSVTAVFAGDGTYATSTSSAVSQTVSKASTTTTITTDLSSATVVGQAYTVAYAVAVTAPGGGTIPGADTVTVSDGSQSCTGTITAGSCSLTSTTSGAKTITATYAGDANYITSASAGTAHTVGAASTTTTITTNLSTATVAGQAYTVAYTVAAASPGGGSIPGSENVTVSDGTNSCTATVSVGNCSLTSTIVGAKTITATYAGDANYITSASAGTAHTVNAASTTTVVASSLNPSATGQLVTFTATITTSSPGAGLPLSGDIVTFYDGGTLLGTGTTTGSNTATFATSGLSIATHSITAVFGGDVNLSGSTSSALSQKVTTLPGTSLFSTVNPSVYSQSVIFSAIVSPKPTDGDVVTFYDGVTSLGTATTTSGIASLTVSTLSVSGNPHSITASFPGDANVPASTSSPLIQTITPASTTTNLSSTFNPTVFGQTTIFTATVDSVSPGSAQPANETVMYYDSGALNGFNWRSTWVGTNAYAVSDAVYDATNGLSYVAVIAVPIGGVSPELDTTSSWTLLPQIGTKATNASGVAALPFSLLALGAHHISAVYDPTLLTPTPDTNYTGSTSSVISLTVNQAASNPVVSSSASPAVFGQPVTLTATVFAVSPGSGTAQSGNIVTFYDGGLSGTNLGTATTNALGVASLPATSALSVGVHSITAVYAGDSNLLPGTSLGVFSQVVNKASTTIAVASSGTPTQLGDSVTFTATVSVTAPGIGAPAQGETVTFKDGATVLGTGIEDLTGFVYTFTTANLSIATHSITAVYSGDTNFLTSTSPVFSQVVTKTSTTTTIGTINPSGVFVGQQYSVPFTVLIASGHSGTIPDGENVTVSDGTGGSCTTTTVSGAGSCTLTSTTAGTKSITATYVGDTNNSTSISAGISQVVSAVSTTTTLTTSVTPTLWGQSTTFTATIAAVSPEIGFPATGETVTFYDIWGSKGYNWRNKWNSANAYAVKDAVYENGSSYVAVAANTNTDPANDVANNNSLNWALIPQTAINWRSTWVNTTAYNPNDAVIEGTVAYVAVQANTGVDPANDVANNNSANWALLAKVGTGNTNPSGVATLASTSLAPGAYSVTAVYDPALTVPVDNNYLGSKSTPVSQVVNQATPTVTLTSSANPSVFGQPVTFTATVAAQGPGNGTAGAGEAVAFFDITAMPLFNWRAPWVSVNTYAINDVVSESGSFYIAVAANTGVDPANDVANNNSANWALLTPLGAPLTNSSGVATYTTSTLSVAMHPITAVYNDDANLLGAASGAVSQVVNAASTTTTITSISPNSGVVVGQPYTVNFTVAIVSPGTGTFPADTVTVTDAASGGQICTGTINALGVGSCQLTSITVGTKTVKATYAGDTDYNTSTSAGTTQVIAKASTTTTITSITPTGSVVGQGYTVAYTVTVTSPGGGTIPGTETVTVTDGAATCPATTVAAGSCLLTSTTAGSKTVKATYAGDTNYNTSTSVGTTQVVSAASTTTTLTSSVNPSVHGQTVTFTATVAAVSPGGGVPTSATVTFKDGTTTLGTATSSGTTGIATYTTSATALTLGTNSITAVYAGATNYATSTSSALSQVVNQATPTVALTSSANPSVTGQTVTFTATVTATSPGSGTAGTGETVTFLNGATTLGTGTTNASGVATYTTTATALTVGGSPYSITASYPGDTNLIAGTSSVLSQVVNAASTTTTVSAGTLGTATVTGQSYPVAYTVAVASPGTGTIPGTEIVTVSDGTSTCTGTVTAGTCSLTSITAGALNITASYAGDTNFKTSTSTSRSHTVNKANTTTSITSITPNSGVVVGEQYTVAFSVAITSPGGGTILGTDTVTVKDATTGGQTCTAPYSQGNCLLTSTSNGIKTITATYNGGTNYNTSTSTGVSQTIYQPPSFTSAASTTFQLRVASVPFTATATGYPAAMTYTESGPLPTGVTFSNGVLSGTPTMLGVFPITFTASNGIAPDAIQNFTLTVNTNGNITYTQPFNANHGWTYTVYVTCNEPAGTFGSAGSCANNPSYTTSCATSPCIEASATSGTGLGGVTGGGQSGYFQSPASPALTWQSLGVPAGATVTQLQGNWWDQASSCATGTTAEMEVVNSLGNWVTVGGPVGPQVDVSADSATGGVTHTGVPMAVIAADQASNTTIILRLDLNPQSPGTGFGGTTCALSADNYQLIITYTTPKRRTGQLIIGWNRTSDGPFSNMWSRRVESENE